MSLFWRGVFLAYYSFEFQLEEYYLGQRAEPASVCVFVQFASLFISARIDYLAYVSLEDIKRF